MKTKLFIAASLLLAASVSSAYASAQWVNYSAVNVNGTWYNCSASWADGGYFNGKDLGYITGTSLSIGGNTNVKDWESINWGGGTMKMFYKIDNTVGEHTLTFSSWDDANKTMQFQSGGTTFSPKAIDISELSAGTHTIEVWFLSDGQYDNNGGLNYKASFYTGPVIELNSTADNSSILSNNTGADVNVIINNYTLYKDGDWNTLCLPFNLSGTQLGASQLKDVDIWKLNTTSSFDQSTGSLVLNFVHQEESNYKIDAGVPYLVKWNNHGEPIVNPLFKGVTIPNENPGSTDGTNVSFMGTYTFESYTSDNEYRYFVGAGNKLYYVGSGSSTSAFHAYFELESSTPGASGVKAIVLNFGDEETSIKQINNTESATDTYYTLDGRRLNDKPATAGLYIINGKKVVIK